MRAKKELLLISFAFFLAHVLTTLTGGYGIFRDELYYIACSNHLSWGYVDQPPLSVFLLALNRMLLGDSLFSLHLLPAIAGAAFVYIAGLLAGEFGGGKFSQTLTAVSAAITPVYMSLFYVYSMNAFDMLFCILTIYVLARIINTGQEKLWLLFGVIVGIGLENKWSMLFLCAGLGIGLLLTPRRRQLLNRWIWVGGAIAVLLNVPHILWQMRNHWPTLEFMHNATAFKNARVSPFEFFSGLVQMMHPFTLVIWGTGFAALLFAPRFRNYRVFVYAFAAIALVFILQNGKPYYLASFFPPLIAAGSVFVEQITSPRYKAIRPVLLIALLIGGLIAAPFTLPFLPVETYIRYAKALGMEPHSEERDRPGKLSQHYADMFGWKEMADTVASVYQKLTPEEKRQCGIFADNYGEAAAIDFYGRKYGLPPAISGHNSYFLWGPGKATGEVMIVIGGELQDHQPYYKECHQAATIENEYARSFETDLGVFVCHGLKEPVAKVWPQVKQFI